MIPKLLNKSIGFLKLASKVYLSVSLSLSSRVGRVTHGESFIIFSPLYLILKAAIHDPCPIKH